jgi:hypothetical protein
MMQNAFCARDIATIANNGTVSDAIAIENFLHGGFQLGTFTGTAMTFQVSDDDTTYVALNNDSGAIALTVAQNKAYALPDAVMKHRFFKFVAGSSQGQATSIAVTLKY